MKWEEVFDKYFVINHDTHRVLVFIPGSYDGSSIRYAWATREAIEDGVNVFTLYSHTYILFGAEIKHPSNLFNDWFPMETISKEERICRKIRVMEERWKKFQETKAAKNQIKTVLPKVKKDYTGRFIGYDWTM